MNEVPKDVLFSKIYFCGLFTFYSSHFRDVVFLFNGAEEQVLPASHAFVTRHKWARGVGAFVNIESAGSASGRELIFQAGQKRHWILDTYLREAPRPSANVVAQELFQSGIIPSDTDFRIFRDFGNMSGLDMAFIDNGYVYHTDQDDMSNVDLGSVYRAGENVLAVARALAVRPTFPKAWNFPAQQVFFDFFGFHVSYSLLYGQSLNLMVCAVVSFVVAQEVKTAAKKTDVPTRTIVVDALRIMLGRAYALLLSLAFVWLLSLFFYLLGITMTWYKSMAFVVPFFVFPTVAINIVVMHWVLGYISFKRAGRLIDMFVYNCIMIEFVALTLVTSQLSIGSAYLPCIMVLFPCIAHQVRRWLLSSSNRKAYDIVTPIFNPLMLLPLMHLMSLSLMVFSFFVPLMGRATGGWAVPPDVAIGALAVLATHFVTAYAYVRVAKNIDNGVCVRILSLLFLLCLSLVLFASPYTTTRRQRLGVLHTKRTFYDVGGGVKHNDSGFAIEKMDYYDSGDLERLVPGFKDKEVFGRWNVAECEYIFCGLPFDRPKLSKTPPKRFWIAQNDSLAPSMEGAKDVRLKMTGAEFNSGENVKRLNFDLFGPKRISLALSASEGLKLVGWSLGDKVPLAKAKWNGSDSHFVVFLQGKTDTGDDGKRSFWLEFSESGENTPSNGNVLTLMINGHHMFGPERADANFEAFLGSFPEWTFPWSWTVDLKSYEFLVEFPVDGKGGGET